MISHATLIFSYPLLASKSFWSSVHLLMLIFSFFCVKVKSLESLPLLHYFVCITTGYFDLINWRQIYIILLHLIQTPFIVTCILSTSLQFLISVFPLFCNFRIPFGFNKNEEFFQIRKKWHRNREKRIWPTRYWLQFSDNGFIFIKFCERAICW